MLNKRDEARNNKRKINVWDSGKKAKEIDRETEGWGCVFVPGAEFGQTGQGDVFIHIFRPVSWERGTGVRDRDSERGKTQRG